MARLETTVVLDAAKREAVAAQTPIIQGGHFYLAGGTGLALHLGHRRSRDLDWFTPQPFDGARLAEALPKLALKPTDVVQSGPDTVRAYYGELETSFIRYSVVVARPVWIGVGTVRVPVADLETLAVMKAGAVINRGTRRDFIDVHALSRSPGWSLQRFVQVAEDKLGAAAAQLPRALVYFADAEREPMPEKASGAWARIKQDLISEVKTLMRSRDRGMER